MDSNQHVRETSSGCQHLQHGDGSSSRDEPRYGAHDGGDAEPGGPPRYGAHDGGHALRDGLSRSPSDSAAIRDHAAELDDGDDGESPHGGELLDCSHIRPGLGGLLTVGEWLQVPPIGYGAHLAAFVRRVGPLAVPDAIVTQRAGPNRPSKRLPATCIMNLGNRAVYFRASPVRPPRNCIPPVGYSRRWLSAKTAFERSCHLAASHGWRLPTRRLG